MTRLIPFVNTGPGLIYSLDIFAHGQRLLIFTYIVYGKLLIKHITVTQTQTRLAVNIQYDLNVTNQIWHICN